MPPNPPSAPSKELHVFPNPAPERDYVIQFQVPEFTCHCPLTGQPDFAHFTIDMIADELCVELKSLKMYFWSYRNEGAFHEKVTNQICDDTLCISPHGGAIPPLHCRPGCTADADCGTDKLCLCGQGARANTCVPGNCRADSDCAGSYRCETYCRSAKDACHDNSECKAPEHMIAICMYLEETHAWGCKNMVPRPPG